MYLFVGFCCVGLAVLHAQRGSVTWPTVFGLAALVNAYLSIRFILPPRFGGTVNPEAGSSGASAVSSALSSEAMRRSLQVYESQMKRWLVIAIVGWAATAILSLLVPFSSLLVAVLAVFATVRHLRCRRSVNILKRALAVTTNGPGRSTGGGVAQ